MLQQAGLRCYQACCACLILRLAHSACSAGDWIELQLDTRAPAPPGKPAPAGNSLVWLTSLRSYQVGLAALPRL